MPTDPISSPPPPSAQAQLTFLRDLRRLLDEGTFTATYKYALLHAIADLCVTNGDGSGEALTFSTRELADRFIRLYWRQAAPFPAAGVDRPSSRAPGVRPPAPRAPAPSVRAAGTSSASRFS